MVKSFRTIICAAGPLVLLSAVAHAAPPQANPYALIIEQNIFRLNPAPALALPQSAPPPDVKITGIIKIGTELKALFAIPPKDAKDSASYVCLSEGQRDGDIELIKIFAEKEECEVINGGTRMKLSFKNNSYAAVQPRISSSTQPGNNRPCNQKPLFVIGVL